MPDGTTQTDVRTENMDVREVGFHPPLNLDASVYGLATLQSPERPAL